MCNTHDLRERHVAGIDRRQYRADSALRESRPRRPRVPVRAQESHQSGGQGRLGPSMRPGPSGPGQHRVGGGLARAVGAREPADHPQRIGLCATTRLMHHDAANARRRGLTSRGSRVMVHKPRHRRQGWVRWAPTAPASTPGQHPRPGPPSRAPGQGPGPGPQEPISRTTGADLAHHRSRSRAPQEPISRAGAVAGPARPAPTARRRPAGRRCPPSGGSGAREPTPRP